MPADTHRLHAVLDSLDEQYASHQADPQQKAKWHLARAMMIGYALRYATEDFEVLAVERTFEAEIRNPDTGRASPTSTMAGKVDGVVKSLADGRRTTLGGGRDSGLGLSRWTDAIR